MQQGICQVDGGDLDEGEKTLRSALTAAKEAADRGEPADEYVTAQGQFFVGEIYRLHCEGVTFDPDAKADALSKTLEYKAQLLLSAQGHYLRAIKIGNGYWATAAGERIGNLYEVLYRQMMDSPTPKELNAEEAEVYRQELRRRIKILLTKAIGVYETTVATAERIGTAGPFVDRARASLERMKQLLLAEADVPDEPPAAGAAHQAVLAPAQRRPTTTRAAEHRPARRARQRRLSPGAPAAPSVRARHCTAGALPPCAPAASPTHWIPSRAIASAVMAFASLAARRPAAVLPSGSEATAAATSPKPSRRPSRSRSSPRLPSATGCFGSRASASP